MEMPTMRRLFAWVPTNTAWRQQSGTLKSQGARVMARTQSTSLENAQRKRSFGVVGFVNSLGDNNGGKDTRARFGSSSGHSRGGDDWEMSSSASSGVLNDGKELDALTKVQSEDLGGSKTDRLKDAMR